MHVTKLFDLAGKSALVTGGGRGIGRHLAVGLAEAGADVAVASRKLANCETVAAQIQGLGRRGLAVEMDLAREDDITSLVERVLGELGGIDILVNNDLISRPFSQLKVQL